MQTIQYLAFILGTNVEGYHKIPVGELKKLLQTASYQDVQKHS